MALRSVSQPHDAAVKFAIRATRRKIVKGMFSDLNDMPLDEGRAFRRAERSIADHL